MAAKKTKRPKPRARARAKRKKPATGPEKADALLARAVEPWPKLTAAELIRQAMAMNQAPEERAEVLELFRQNYLSTTTLQHTGARKPWHDSKISGMSAKQLADETETVLDVWMRSMVMGTSNEPRAIFHAGMLVSFVHELLYRFRKRGPQPGAKPSNMDQGRTKGGKFKKKKRRRK